MPFPVSYTFIKCIFSKIKYIKKRPKIIGTQPAFSLGHILYLCN